MTFQSVRHRVAFNTGRALLVRGRERPAAFFLGRAARFAPDDWETHNNLAVALLKQSRWEEAAAVARRAIEVDPEQSDSHQFLGIALLQLERWDEAATVYRRMLDVEPDQYESLDRLGMALCRLERWDDVVEICESALKLNADQYELHHRLGLARLQLGQWEAAAEALSRALEFAVDNPAAAAELPTLRVNLAMAQLYAPSESVMTSLLQQAEALQPGMAARLSRGVELLKDEQWEEALSELAPVSTELAGVDFLRVDPLVRLGRLDEAVAAQHRVLEVGGPLPGLPGRPASERFEERQAGFWTVENVGADVLAVEEWLERLTEVPAEAESNESPRLMFVLDNDFGELATVKFFILGQELTARTTLLLPERLYVHNVDAVPGRTEQYGSVDDILAAVDRDQTDIVFLCAGYLFCPHLEFSHQDFERLIEQLRERDCRVVTADPFLGLMSKQDPRTVIRFEISSEHARRLSVAANIPEAVDEMMKSRRAAEERTWASFTRSEATLRDTYHLYPSYCDVSDDDMSPTDARNVATFNDQLLLPRGLGGAEPRADVPPHWLFILSTADCEIQAVAEGEAGFLDIVASKLLETRAAGRHPILIGPRAFVDELVRRMPTVEGIDILSQCPFNQFYSLLLSAEHAFYWNVVSHSLLIRLYNQLPIVQFDLGHLIRTAPAIHDRIVGWYYQGFESQLRDHRDALTLETVDGWAEVYRRESGRLLQRFQRAPSPGNLVAELMERSPVPGLGSGRRAR